MESGGFRRRNKPELLFAHASEPPSRLKVLDVRRRALETLSGIELAPGLRTLLASGNNLRDLEECSSAKQLWWLDVSDCRLDNLQALASFSALGRLDVRHNDLRLDTLLQLRGINIVELLLQPGNDVLGRGAPPAAVRRACIWILPQVWVLDSQFVTQAEREEAAEYYESGKGARTLLATRMREREEVEGSIFRVSHESSADGAKMLECIDSAPMRSSLLDAHRLRYLRSYYEREVAVMNGYFERAYVTPGCLPISLPPLHADEVLSLRSSLQLDIAIVLSTVAVIDVSEQIVEEALVILLTGELSREAIEDLACLPSFAATLMVALIYGNRLAAASSSSSTPAAPESAFERELWNTLPSLGVGAAKPTPATRRVRSRRALILLSRSPSFPSLLDSAVDAASRSTLARLQPLLAAAGMTGADLAGGAAVDRPHSSSAASGAAGWAEWGDYDEGAATGIVLDVAEPMAPARDLVRQPQRGDHVRVFPADLGMQVTVVLGCPEPGYMQLARFDGFELPPYFGQLVLPIAEFLWMPPDHWRHSSVVTRSYTQPKKTLFRKPSGFSKTGISHSEGSLNLPIAAGAAGRPTLPAMDKEDTAAAPRPLQLFSTHDTWEPGFVLAPPSLVAAQNSAAAEAGLLEADGSRAWTSLQTVPYTLMSPDIPLAPPDYELHPRRSAAEAVVARERAFQHAAAEGADSSLAASESYARSRIASRGSSRGSSALHRLAKLRGLPTGRSSDDDASDRPASASRPVSSHSRAGRSVPGGGEDVTAATTAPGTGTFFLTSVGLEAAPASEMGAETQGDSEPPLQFAGPRMLAVEEELELVKEIVDMSRRAGEKSWHAVPSRPQLLVSRSVPFAKPRTRPLRASTLSKDSFMRSSRARRKKKKRLAGDRTKFSMRVTPSSTVDGAARTLPKVTLSLGSGDRPPLPPPVIPPRSDSVPPAAASSPIRSSSTFAHDSRPAMAKTAALGGIGRPSKLERSSSSGSFMRRTAPAGMRSVTRRRLGSCASLPSLVGVPVSSRRSGELPSAPLSDVSRASVKVGSAAVSR